MKNFWLVRCWCGHLNKLPLPVDEDQVRCSRCGQRPLALNGRRLMIEDVSEDGWADRSQ